MSHPSESSSQPSSSGSTTSALAAEIQSLRMLLNGVLATILVASLGINMLLFKQMRLLQVSNTLSAAQFESAVKKFNEGDAKRIEDLVNKLKVFAKTNPEFGEILAKHLGQADGQAQPQ